MIAAGTSELARPSPAAPYWGTTVQFHSEYPAAQKPAIQAVAPGAGKHASYISAFGRIVCAGRIRRIMTNDERQPTCLSREELYEKVWSSPIVKLAKSFGVSDAAIHKACEKHTVPKPPRGYWAQRAFGIEIKPPPLEPVVDPELNNVVIGQQQPNRSGSKSQPKVDVEVPERLASPHPLVQQTLRSIENSREQRGRDFEGNNKADRLNISVGEGSLQRGLRIWDALLKALESRGWSTAIEGERWRPKTVINKDDVKIYIRMTEKSVSTPHIPTAAERDRMKKYPAFHGVPEKGSKLSGELLLGLDDQYTSGIRRPRADGAKGKLEDRLGDFICVIDEEYENELVKMKERQEWQRQYEEEQRQREEAERRRQEEAKKIAELEAMTEHWHKAERIRRFLSIVEERALDKGKLDPASNLALWIAWGRRYAQEIDPIR